jgi:allantoinase
MMQTLVLTSNNVQLPGNEEPCPATIEVQCNTGKIIRVTPGKTDGQKYQDRDTVEVWDLGDLIVLPGFVEYVEIVTFSIQSYPATPLVHMYI